MITLILVDVFYRVLTSSTRTNGVFKWMKPEIRFWKKNWREI